MVTIPKNEKRTPGARPEKAKLWIFGAPYSGKTQFADSFPDALILSTDGNIGFCTSPYILIRDQVSVEGRITKTQTAWKFFRDVIDELAKGQNTYKTLVFDLVDDLYELCRFSKYQDMGITHESDDPYKSWDKIRGEFRTVMRKAANLDYNIIFISHEDVQTDITNRRGEKDAIYNPSIQPKVANYLSGLVDITARVVVDKGEHKLLIVKKNSDIIGTRITKELPDEIPLNYKDFENLYNTTRSE